MGILKVRPIVLDNIGVDYSIFGAAVQRYSTSNQARSQEFSMGEGLFWKLGATSNDLDPDFDWSSLRLRRFFCPNFDDLRKKKGLRPG